VPDLPDLTSITSAPRWLPFAEVCKIFSATLALHNLSRAADIIVVLQDKSVSLAMVM